ncbi:hypothetical protein EW145_g7267 [Phellinidium pouzarii]|uniref:ER membrane protein complex subunit 2 n=1 Tax=Phellinidium pouzarii TaxID=167371 RepID=A0A4S4KLS7_9AGAM|nr:hypothetical protein EW145_g7267 [Phellinidium pouzarii]
MSAQLSLQKLASFRAQNSRQSLETVEHGTILLKNKKATSADPDACAWLEQLVLAAIDVGRLSIADECIASLKEKFPGSPRVDVLIGIRKEATLPAQDVLAYYDGLLDSDEANAAAWKRKVSILRRMGDVSRAVDELSAFVDTYYTDVEGWLELADIYSSCNQYDSALSALQHVLLLAPQNPFYVLQAAEVAYTAGDITLATKFFLGVVDMTEDPDLGPAARIEAVPEGIAVRAWFGLKQCTRRLIKDPRTAAASASQTLVPEHVNFLDELATERLLTSYSTYSSGPRKGPVCGREELVKCMEHEYEEPQQPSLLDKMTKQMMRHPLIPAGMIVTAGTLTMAFKRMQQRDAVGYQRWLRARVLAQGLTIVAIVYAGVQEMGMGVLTGKTRPAVPPPTSAYESREFEKRLKDAEEAHRIEEIVKDASAHTSLNNGTNISTKAPASAPSVLSTSSSSSSWTSWLGWSKKD